MDKANIINYYKLTATKISLMEAYLTKLKITNKKINLVGESTLINFWDRHVNDSLQISQHINKKNASIIDLGTGAGLPGIILCIYGYKNILMVDSKLKKINFIKEFATENKILIKTMCSRVENIKNRKFDFIICRAFAQLTKTLHYSLKFSKKNTSLLFLKGRNVKEELLDAKKYFNFKNELFESKSVGGGYILKIGDLKKI